MWWALRPVGSVAIGRDWCPPSIREVRIIVSCIPQHTLVTLDTAWSCQDHCGNLTWVIQRNVKHCIPSVIWSKKKQAGEGGSQNVSAHWNGALRSVKGFYY